MNQLINNESIRYLIIIIIDFIIDIFIIFIQNEDRIFQNFKDPRIPNKKPSHSRRILHISPSKPPDWTLFLPNKHLSIKQKSSKAISAKETSSSSQPCFLLVNRLVDHHQTTSPPLPCPAFVSSRSFLVDRLFPQWMICRARMTETSLEKNKEEERGDHVHSLFSLVTLQRFPVHPVLIRYPLFHATSLFLRTLSPPLSATAFAKLTPSGSFSISALSLPPPLGQLLSSNQPRHAHSSLSPRALLPPNLSRISDATMRDGGQKLRRVESGSRPIIRKTSPLLSPLPRITLFFFVFLLFF